MWFFVIPTVSNHVHLLAHHSHLFTSYNFTSPETKEGPDVSSGGEGGARLEKETESVTSPGIGSAREGPLAG